MNIFRRKPAPASVPAPASNLSKADADALQILRQLSSQSIPLSNSDKDISHKIASLIDKAERSLKTIEACKSSIKTIAEMVEASNRKRDAERRAAIAKDHPASAMLVKVPLYTNREAVEEWAKDNGAVVAKIPDYHIIITDDIETYAEAFLKFTNAKHWEEM